MHAPQIERTRTGAVLSSGLSLGLSLSLGLELGTRTGARRFARGGERRPCEGRRLEPLNDVDVRRLIETEALPRVAHRGDLLLLSGCGASTMCLSVMG